MRFISKIHPGLSEHLIGFRIDGAGSVFDPFPGAHHLLEHLLSAKIHDAIAKLGGRYDASTYREYQTHALAIPCDQVVDALKVVSNAMRSICDGAWSNNDRISAVRAMQRERQVHQRDPHERLMEALDRATLCPEYARPTSVIEPPDTLQDAGLVDLAHAAFCSDHTTVVTVAPDERALRLVEQGVDMPATAKMPPITFPPCSWVAKSIQAPTTKKDEAFIRLDFPGFGLASCRAAFNPVASSFLVGQVGALSRALGEASGGWCYDLFSDTAQFAMFGQVSFGAACAPGDLDHVQRVAMDVVSRLCSSPPIDTVEWKRLGKDTAHDVDMLTQHPYDLLDFLLTEAHPLFVGNPDPKMLLDPWNVKKEEAIEALRTIFDPKTISIGVMK